MTTVAGTKIRTSGELTVELTESEILGWLRVIRSAEDSTGDLDADLRLLKKYKLGEAEGKAVYMVSQLVSLEASGRIDPPVNLYETYAGCGSAGGVLVYGERRRGRDRRTGRERREQI